MLEGSVQRDPGRMRVNVQLIDAETGNHIWADRFDKPLADLFEMQDEIVARLANQLGTELIAAEARRAQQAPNPNSMDLYFQGLASFNKGDNLENMDHARGFFERALALDPGNVDALLGVGRVDFEVGASFLSNDRDARLAAAEATIDKVLSLRPNDALAHETWASSRCRPIARPKPLPSSSGRWRWIQIWPPLTRISVTPRFLLVAPERPKLM